MGKHEFEELKTTMKYLIKENQWYVLIYVDLEKRTCVYKKSELHKKSTEDNTKAYEEVALDWNIEIRTERITPDEYFFTKIKEDDGNLVYTIKNKKLINYIRDNPRECNAVIEKMTDFCMNHEDYTVRMAAYEALKILEIDELENLKPTREPLKEMQQKNRYRLPLGKYKISCEKEKMTIVFSHLKKKLEYEDFKKEFKMRFPKDRYRISGGNIHKMYCDYYKELISDGGLKEVQNERKNRIKSELPKALQEELSSFGLRVVRADGRGTNHKVSKCRRKKQYDSDRLSGYRIITDKGIVTSGNQFEMYEDDVRNFIKQLKNGDIFIGG